MAETQHRGAVLITGASSGIGQATALLLDKSGYRVFASVRKPQDADRLRSQASDRLCAILMDITEPEQIAAAAALIRERLGPDEGLGALINNAGVCEAGPFEIISIDRLRRQMEVNVISHVVVIQAFLPLIRRGRGRIINVVSAIADNPMAFLGAYAASKCAMRGVSIALRRELLWWGIPVSSIDPGFVKAAIWNDTDRMLETIRQEDQHGYYSDLLEALFTMLEPSLQIAASAESIAAVIKKVLEARRPKAVYRCGPGSSFAWMVKLVPESLVHWTREWYVRRYRRQKHKQVD